MEKFNNIEVTSYKLYGDQDLFTNCREIIEITDIQGMLYVSYITEDDKEVRLVYNKDGLCEKVIYDSNSDTAYIENKNEAIVLENFRAGISFKMDEDVLEKIHTFYEQGKIDELNKIDDIDIKIDTEGNLFVEPEVGVNQTTRAIEGFASTSELLKDLKASFGMYENKQVLSTSKYCSALKKNVSVKVLATRNAYVKKSANWRKFAIETTIAVISAYLGLPSSAIVIILTAHGIAISAVNQIKEAVTLYKSAIYTFSGIKRSYVYDTTVYNEWVKVYGVSSTGEFTGGYNSNDQFTWVISKPSTALEKSNSTLATTAINNYNADVESHGYCSLYEP